MSYKLILFEVNVCICDRFPALSPFDVREKRFKDVFNLIKNLTEYNKKNKKTKTGKKIIRKPASDNWF